MKVRPFLGNISKWNKNLGKFSKWTAKWKIRRSWCFISTCSWFLVSLQNVAEKRSHFDSRTFMWKFMFLNKLKQNELRVSWLLSLLTYCIVANILRTKNYVKTKQKTSNDRTIFLFLFYTHIHYFHRIAIRFTLYRVIWIVLAFLLLVTLVVASSFIATAENRRRGEYTRWKLSIFHLSSVTAIIYHVWAVEWTHIGELGVNFRGQPNATNKIYRFDFHLN